MNGMEVLLMKEDNKESFSDYYRDKHVTGTYDEQRLKTEYRRKKREIEMNTFLELLNIKDDETILECGCSSGYMTQFLGENVTAVDTSGDMIELAKQKNPAAEFHNLDMFKIDTLNKQFDKIVSKRVMTHLLPDELERFFKVVNKCLKDDGVFVFDVENKSLLRNLVRPIYVAIFRTTGFKTYQHDIRSISKILDKAGFVVMSFKYFNHRVGKQLVIKAKKK